MHQDERLCATQPLFPEPSAAGQTRPAWSVKGVRALLHEDRKHQRTLISNSAQDKESRVKDLANIWPRWSLFQPQWCMCPR